MVEDKSERSSSDQAAPDESDRLPPDARAGTNDRSPDTLIDAGDADAVASGDDDRSFMEEATDATRRARGALVSTIAERAAESSWLDRQLDRAAILLARYERWQESPEQSQLDLWATHFSGWFRQGDRPDQFAGVQRAVNQARLDRSWDVYLGWVTTLAILAAILGGAIGTGVTILLAVTGGLPGWAAGTAPTAVGLDQLVARLRGPLLGLLISLILATILGSLSFVGLYFYPYLERYQRRAEIDELLPYGVTYMYALSRGQLPLADLVRHLADSEEAYGVLAEEMGLIVQQLDYFGRDVRQALRETRVHTPSERFADLLDDLGTVLDTGAELTPFLHSMTEEMREKARRAQESYLETLEVFSEVYVVAMVVTPLLLVTILVSMGAIRPQIIGGTLPLVIYGYIPIGTLGFWFALEALRPDEPEATAEALTAETSETTVADIEATIESLDGGRAGGTSAGTGTTSEARGGSGAPMSDGRGEPTANGGAIPRQERRGPAWDRDVERDLLSSLAHAKRRARIKRWLRAPVTKAQHQPLVALSWSLPLALLFIAGVMIANSVSLGAGVGLPGWATPLLALYPDQALVSRPVLTTTLFGVIPFVITTLPVAYYYERHARRQHRINQELPTIFRQLGSANQAGVTMHEAFGVVGQTASGVLAREFRRLDTALAWNAELETALARLSERLRNPRFTRAALLILEGSSAARDLGPILDALEADLRNAADLDRDRRQSTLIYLFLTVVGFFVFLGVIGVLMAQLLPALAQAQQAAAEAQNIGRGVLGGTFNLVRMKRLFYHGLLLQAVTSGMMAGQLGRGDWRAGLKFAIGQVLVVAAVFFLI